MLRRAGKGIVVGMKVFISWSKKRSRAFAEALRDWLPEVIQDCKPWMSSKDIDLGQRWSSEIASQLNEARLGVLCVTPENLGSVWLAFEAGALSKSVAEGRVIPYLFGVAPRASVSIS